MPLAQSEQLEDENNDEINQQHQNAHRRPPHQWPQQGDWFTVGETRMKWSDRLHPMIESTEQYQANDINSLRQSLRTQGYILIRNFFDLDEVRQARSVLTNVLHSQFQMIDESMPVDCALINADCSRKQSIWTGFTSITHDPRVLRLIESDRLVTLFKQLFGADQVSTFDTKWVRVQATNQSTDEHCDYYRFAAHGRHMCTAWIPLGDYDLSHSTLAVCPKSHLTIDHDRNNDEDAKTELPSTYVNSQQWAAAPWHCSPVKEGDLIVFDICLVHASTVNERNFYRLSLDTRWQATHMIQPEFMPSYRTLS